MWLEKRALFKEISLGGLQPAGGCAGLLVAARCSVVGQSMGHAGDLEKGSATHITGMTGYVGESMAPIYEVGETPSSTSGGGAPILINADSNNDDIDFVFMVESLFVLPESFSDDLISMALQEENNPEVLYVSGDLTDGVILTEDEAVAILANYGQVRNYLHKK